MTANPADESATTTAGTGLPFGLKWEIEPASWHFDGVLGHVHAAGRTDIFIDPNGSSVALNGARALAASPGQPWQFTAHVTAKLRETYDAAALLLWSDDRHFAKLCFERSPHGHGTVVSVVNRDVSDDANAWVVDSEDVWLRISNVATDVYAFHSSNDGVSWDLARYFALAGDNPMRYGIEAQSPVGDGCVVTFSELAFTTSHLKNIRDGS